MRVFWVLPVLSGLVWLGMLLAMIIGWAVDLNKAHLSSMSENQHIPYISDIGATHRFKPVFIACSAVMCATLDLSLLCDLWLRSSRRLTPLASRTQATLGTLSILFAIAGTAGLVLLTVFDVAHHKNQHDGFLLLFIGGYVISAIFVCWEYQRLGVHNRDTRILALSFWVKLAFIIIEVILAVIFASFKYTRHRNGAAVVEWVIAVIFCFYALSFCIDLYPAVHATGRGRDLDFLESGRPATADGMMAEHGALPSQIAMEQEPNSFAGDVYSQSAARATRIHRPRYFGQHAHAAEPGPPGPVSPAYNNAQFEQLSQPQPAEMSEQTVNYRQGTAF